MERLLWLRNRVGDDLLAAAVITAGGAVAEQMRREHGLSNHRPTWPGHDSHAKALADAWSRCKRGDATAFGEVCRRLRTDPQTGFARRFDDDITKWPSLHLLNTEPDELAEAARAHLTAADPPTGDWLLKAGSITNMAVDGYAGLSFMARRPDADAWFDGLPTEVWARWAPAVVR